MNTSKLKSFAPAVRRQLMEAVARKLDYVLSAQTPDYLSTFATQVGTLRELAQADRDGLIERVAYTWFNRFAALRYLDARGWHPFRARVLMAVSSEQTQPEILKLTRTGTMPEELRLHTKPSRLNDLLDGRIPSTDPQGEVYRHLVLAACRFYHALLPNLFERLDDETEFLLPDDLLTEQSVVHGFRVDITDDDCAEVEVLGWLYQFYISEKKDAVMRRKAVVSAEDIPAVTQIFTPHWIVRYLLENSLGRLWLLNRPDTRLRDCMGYYMDSEPETEFPRIGKPEEIRVLDPAVGSGHMLTYAFDLLYFIYEEEGYAPSDIPGLILTHNLSGMDICPRAAQFASLALVLKAREKSRGFFQADKLVRPCIVRMTDVRFADGELRDYVDELGLGSLFDQQVLELLHQFEEAKTLGSLIKPCIDSSGIAFVRDAIKAKDLGGQLFLHETHTKVLRVLEQASRLSGLYHVVVANPPYMGSNKFNPALKRFVASAFKEGKADLYSCFILRNLSLLLNQGFSAMITLPNWMFMGSWADLRERLLEGYFLVSLVHNGRGMWGPDFGSCGFILRNAPGADEVGSFKRLFDKQGEVNSPEELERRFLDNNSYPPFRVTSRRMMSIPGKPIAYWVSKTVADLFARSSPLSSVGQPRQGLATGDNALFLRNWWEPSMSRIGFDCTDLAAAETSRRRWFPCNKGGPFRKWYGNHDHIVDWEFCGRRMRNFVDEDGNLRSRPQNIDFSFREGMTWSTSTISQLSMRFSPSGRMFEHKGSVCFFDDHETLEYGLAFANTAIVEKLLLALAPTADYNEGPLGKLPFIEANAERVREIARDCISQARADWDNFETSWDFHELPLLRKEIKSAKLQISWQSWKDRCDDAIKLMQERETENNRLFIDAYGLQQELKPAVPDDQITLARANPRKDMVALLSYAVGCMMGRYSLDRPGLVLADAGGTLEHYDAIVGRPSDRLAFAPDSYGIIPILDGEWFGDDIVSRTREFLRITFGETTLRENMQFVEESLGKDLRKYFLTDFYKDHLQTYKKRPIYWLVQSPRKGFSVLIYSHRYTRDTMNVVLNRYLRDYQVKLRNRASHLAHMEASEASARKKAEARKEASKITKTLHECEEWERQTILPLAQARIELDLDDGVMVNYLKLGEALAPVPGMESKSEE